MSDKIVLNTARKPGEDECEYICRICSMKHRIGTWEDVTSLLNRELNKGHTRSKYSKTFQKFQSVYDENVTPEENESRIKEAERERIKIQTEKLELNRWKRECVRDEMYMDKIIAAIRELPALRTPRMYQDFIPEETDMATPERIGILCYGDEHYGAEFDIRGLHGELINAYSVDIFEARMYELLMEAVCKVRNYGLDKLKVYSFGDELDGILRVSQLRKLRYGVVESAIRYAEFICDWLNKLTSCVSVEFCMTEGNHTELRQLGQPKGTFADDNMSRIIKEFIKVRMENNPRFRMIENESGLIYDTAFGLNILGIHGEVKNMESALKNFSVMYDTPIDILIGGHKHHTVAETVGIGKEVISVPSVMGVDTFSMQIGRTSDAGATFLIIEAGRGVTEQHHIKFTE